MNTIQLRTPIKFLAAAALLWGLWTHAAAVEPGEQEAIDMVERAVALLERDGDGALAVIGKTGGDFHQGELYAFVYDTEAVMLAHPEKPSLVGQSFKGKPDARGKKFRDEIVERALSGGGWTEYVYQKPNESGLHAKRVYSRLASHAERRYVVACGAYGGALR